MKKRVLTLFIILTIAFGIIALRYSFAWFPNEGTYKSQAIDLSNFDISLVGGCQIRPVYTNITDPTNPVEYAAPGANMIHIEQSENVWVPGPLTMLNKSTILTNLRVHIEYSWWDGDSLETVVYTPTQQADFVVDFAVPADWSYDPATLCWDYLPGGAVIAPVDPLVYPLGKQSVLINSMGYSSALAPGNDYEDLPVDIIFKVEAKQAEYADWIQVSP